MASRSLAAARRCRRSPLPPERLKACWPPHQFVLAGNSLMLLIQESGEGCCEKIVRWWTGGKYFCGKFYNWHTNNTWYILDGDNTTAKVSLARMNIFSRPPVLKSSSISSLFSVFVCVAIMIQRRGRSVRRSLLVSSMRTRESCLV